jgi:hypothetical protein
MRFMGLTGVLAGLLLAACNYYEPKGLQAAPSLPGNAMVKANFQTITDAYFKPYCLRCHKGDTPAGDISLVTYQAMIDTGVLVPKDPEKSLIYTMSMDGDMPRRPPMPPKEAIELLRVWIADGALEK